jgi:solute carrier family 25 oxoglutarate transporter 11
MSENRTSASPASVGAGPSAAMKKVMNMGIGGTAGTLVLGLVYPMESIKTVIQLKSEMKEKATIRSVFSERTKSEGFTSLFRGLPAAVVRQFFFASIRLGLYFNVSDYIKAKKNKPVLSMLESTLAAFGAAAIGITTVMPFDVVFVRFQAENAIPKEQRRGYTGLFNALSRIVKEEGLPTLWRGVGPAICRGMAINFGMLVPYEKCKAILAPFLGYTQKNYLLSSAIAGLAATMCCLPFDNIKVRLQRMKINLDGTKPYKGVTDCFIKCIKNEGVFSIWSGFLPFYLFAGSHSMLALLVSDALRIFLGVSNK